MTEIAHDTFISKRCLRNLAAWYAITVPILGIVLFFVGGGACAAWVLISSLLFGVLSMFGNSVRGTKRIWVLIGMLMSGVFGGLALFMELASAMHQ